MPLIRLTKVERRRVFSFVVCLVLAIAAWFLLALNNKYNYSAKTVLIFKNSPTQRAFYPLQSDTVNLNIQGTGWQLLFSRLRISPPSISINLNQLNNKDFIVCSEQLPYINKQLGSTQKVISIKPDTLYFDFAKRIVKKVPIKLIKNIEFEKQYGLNGDIILKPNFVKVAGPIEELNKINAWFTDTLKLKNLQNSTSVKVALQQNIQKNITIYPAFVDVKIPVDEFTEKTIEIPLEVVNNKNFYNIKLYPKKVKVTFMVALNDYYQVDESFITAAVDVNEWFKKRHNRFTVKLTEFPDYCKLVSILPSNVDFVVEK